MLIAHVAKCATRIVCRLLIQFHTVFKDVSAGTAFDVLMDQDYRPNWDDASIKDFDICKLDGYNDIGYYASKSNCLCFYIRL